MPDQMSGSGGVFGGPDRGPEDELGPETPAQQDDLGGPDPAGPEDELGPETPAQRDDLGGPDPAGPEDELRPGQ
jgi:hypothetical protein